MAVTCAPSSIVDAQLALEDELAEVMAAGQLADPAMLRRLRATLDTTIAAVEAAEASVVGAAG